MNHCAHKLPIVNRCQMNCGRVSGDTRTKEEFMADCDDCHTLTERDHDLRAVDNFSNAMMAKLDKKRDEGRSGWQTASAETLSKMLNDHLAKGDPVDVANFCMMLHQNSQRIEVLEARHQEIKTLQTEATDYYQTLCATQLEITQIKARFIAMISDDALAMSYQSLGQYRTALIKHLSNIKEQA